MAPLSIMQILTAYELRNISTSRVRIDDISKLHVEIARLCFPSPSKLQFDIFIMYLLNTRTLTLKSFYTKIPRYAILSHTWGKKEVTFQDIQHQDKEKSDRKVSGERSDREVPGDKSDREVPEDESDKEVPGDESNRKMSRDDIDMEDSGSEDSDSEDSDMEDSDSEDSGTDDGRELEAAWRKIEGACAQARKYDWEWIWIDSCCIDKSSSAELSENINSMYQLYENAGVCYVYLSDVSSKKDPRDPRSRFPKSKWFTRGWTLQELIAPSASVVFLDHLWEEIGTRYTLRDVISAITSIPVQLLEDGDLTKYSIAQKMSWAAFRKTTRPEDRAYSLMGLFDICMPPIYGEGGAKAFMRLQQEIIKTSDDRSIFAWVAVCERDEDGEVVEREPRGLLARSPDEFKGSGRVGISMAKFPYNTSSFSFNNNGLH
ncbi:HET-domain-containing protein [Dendrothele bispora CBS 962.96]|uniref:HET-domain-containing protein n=1 Tax=Dendrothele bispora (strain CBS 962.96) TaxID=1314807 RepID=A0A4S8M096_DENBC|nr:HET-domain-containing protein [Dendrothele bispora CBS 962.96]